MTIPLGFERAQGQERTGGLVLLITQEGIWRRGGTSALQAAPPARDGMMNETRGGECKEMSTTRGGGVRMLCVRAHAPTRKPPRAR